MRDWLREQLATAQARSSACAHVVRTLIDERTPGGVSDDKDEDPMNEFDCDTHTSGKDVADKQDDVEKTGEAHRQEGKTEAVSEKQVTHVTVVDDVTDLHRFLVVLTVQWHQALNV